MRCLPLAALLLAAFVVACAQTSPDGGRPDPVVLDIGPADLGRSLMLSRLVTGTFKDRTWRARVEIEASAEPGGGRLAVVALSALGVPFLTLEQTGAAPPRVTVLDAGVPMPDARYMLFDLQITHWPLAALRPALAKAGMTITEDAAAGRRTVYGADGTRIVEVQASQGGIDGAKVTGETHIRHYDIPYEIRLSPLPAGRRP